jgi:hypothetical protein
MSPLFLALTSDDLHKAGSVGLPTAPLDLTTVYVQTGASRTPQQGMGQGVHVAYPSPSPICEEGTGMGCHIGDVDTLNPLQAM